ncbi:MAG: 5'-methylthioadenosine/adenosylhomocysteine nucleosidase [Bacteroidales bacterium]|nr:5'-methylthioadenosine/adenosylhomocysteine nucleosidase [Bacteroidales bacterium]
MKIGIIVAMSKEFSQIQNLLSDCEQVVKGNYNYVTGTLHNKYIILQHSGIGKVNAALGAENLIKDFSPDIIISTGVAGGADTDLEVMDVVVSSSCAYHDVYCGTENEFGQVQDMPAKYPSPDYIIQATKSIKAKQRIVPGLIVTGDWFVDNTEKMKEILSHFPQAKAVDMESCAIAQTTYLHNIPFCSFRIISDIPLKPNNKKQYYDFWSEIADSSFQITKQFIEKI